MEKQVLLKNILLELNRLPVGYLQHWYELIHAFRENLTTGQPGPSVGSQDDFDWDELVNDVMTRRDTKNEEELQRIKALFQD